MMVNFYRFKKFSNLLQCHHAVTTKNRDESYAFSVALHTGENKEKIVTNRKKIASLLGWKKNIHFVIANQTHSDNIEIIESNNNLGWDNVEDAIENCDALITNKKGIVLSVLTADCVPILLLDTKKNVIATVHAGWKGTKLEIASKTVNRMIETFDSNPKDIIAGIAPSIGACCYEVDEDVAKHFFNVTNAYIEKGEKYMLNLPTINKQQLIQSGLLESNIEMSNICTACEVDTFFSYRKENGCSGRFMSMIALN